MRALAASVLLLACTACLSPQERPSAGPSSVQPQGPCAAARSEPPPGSGEHRLQADLDGDRMQDEVVSWLRDGQRVVQAWLATGETAQPQPLVDGALRTAHDVNRDGRAEVFVTRGRAKGGALVLDGCVLVPVQLAAAPRPWEFAVGPTSALLCRPNGLVEEVVTTGRETVRRAWTLRGDKALGARPLGSGPAGTLAGRIACGR